MLIRIVHIFLAILLFFSSTGLVFHKHYCRNELKGIALFLPAKGCHREKAMADCPMHAHRDQREKKDCCQDKTAYLKGQHDQLNVAAAGLEVSRPPLILLPFALPVARYLSSSLYREQTQYLNYKPPLIVWDLPLRFQTFLC